ncbi:uncharacterized protein EI90DRAFT_3020238 [Cantharellus anzutake]|uniref:uncharacterized protein n=1 Tax=Cantharellus anzutake TaxID=1750568 RepID=UPI001904BEEE|nr:uncharacterized protein EI90DRAFT_3020238 [Cantharellus anzutake]KAF8321864.1 hypothetical protein EI90DRAFT_3020238 [Cantharellus anzutake]
MSGSMNPQTTCRATQSCLGFQPDLFWDVSLLVDRSDFPDLAWLIPDNLTTAQSITPTLIVVATVAIANALVKWLRKKLKEVLTNGEDLVFPFHSIIPQEDRLTTLQELEAGTVRIVVAMTAAQVGLDMAIWNVVILDLLQTSRP